jgi:hypothetical protein
MVARTRMMSIGSWGSLVAVLAAIYATLFAIAGSALITHTPVAVGVLADLTLTAPFAVWWLGVRRGLLPRWTIVVTATLGLAIARSAIGGRSVAVVIAAIDVALTVWLAIRVRRIYRVARAHDGPALESLEAGLAAARIPKRVASMMATELVVFWLAATGWFKRPPANALSIHRRAGWPVYCGVIVFVIAVEAVVFHIALAAMWSPVAAWIASALSIYSMIWFIGDAHALRCYPITIERDELRVSIGLRWRTRIPFSAIASIEDVYSAPEGALDLSVMAPTVAITLRAPIEVHGLFGIRRTATVIALSVDEPDRLRAVTRQVPGAPQPQPRPSRFE